MDRINFLSGILLLVLTRCHSIKEHVMNCTSTVTLNGEREGYLTGYQVNTPQDCTYQIIVPSKYRILLTWEKLDLGYQYTSLSNSRWYQDYIQVNSARTYNTRSQHTIINTHDLLQSQIKIQFFAYDRSITLYKHTSTFKIRFLAVYEIRSESQPSTINGSYEYMLLGSSNVIMKNLQTTMSTDRQTINVDILSLLVKQYDCYLHTPYGRCCNNLTLSDVSDPLAEQTICKKPNSPWISKTSSVSVKFNYRYGVNVFVLNATAVGCSRSMVQNRLNYSESYFDGGKAYVGCKRGYFQKLPNGGFTNQSIPMNCNNQTHQWETLSTCQIYECPYPKAVANGNYTILSRLQDSVITFSCNTGYRQVNGSTTRPCKLNGWTGDEPECQAITTQPSTTTTPRQQSQNTSKSNESTTVAIKLKSESKIDQTPDTSAETSIAVGVSVGVIVLVVAAILVFIIYKRRQKMKANPESSRDVNRNMAHNPNSGAELSPFANHQIPKDDVSQLYAKPKKRPKQLYAVVNKKKKKTPVCDDSSSIIYMNSPEEIGQGHQKESVAVYSSLKTNNEGQGRLDTSSYENVDVDTDVITDEIEMVDNEIYCGD